MAVDLIYISPILAVKSFVKDSSINVLGLGLIEQDKSDKETNKLLKAELDRLVAASGFGEELHVCWVPNETSKLSGEVKAKLILIYESDPTQALQTLHHEFIDFIVCRAIKPYEKIAVLHKNLINALLEQIGKEAYQEKEQVIEALRKLFLQP